MQHRRQVLQAAILVAAVFVEPSGGEQVVHVGDLHGVALGFPDLLDRRTERRVLETIQRLARRNHLGQQRLQEFHVLVDVRYQGEGIQRQRGVLGELDEAAAEVAAGLLVGAADVDDPDPGAGAQIGGGDLVQQQRLAGARGAGNRDVVVAGGIVIDVELHDLAAATAEQQYRRSGALPFGDQGGQMHGVGGGLGGDPLHALQILVEGHRERHGQRSDQRLRHHQGVAGELEAACPEDRARGLLGAGDFVGRGEQGHLVVEIDQLLAIVHGLEDDVPVGLAFLQVGEEAGHVTGGVGGGARGLEVGPVARGLGVEHLHAEGQQEGAGVLQGALVQVADQAAHVPQREARR